MKGLFSKIANILAAAVLCLTCCMAVVANTANAEDKPSSENSESEEEAFSTSISITPVSKMLQLSPNKVYEDIIRVANNGKSTIRFEVYAAPYSYVQSENDDLYTLGFTHENSYTQITRWITIRDKNGNYVKNPIFTAEPGETVEVPYKITTPSSLPNGGQYAVIFAHTLSGTTNANGIKTEASPGMVIYSRAEGDTVTTAEINDMKINQTTEKEDIFEENGQPATKKVTVNQINASAKVRNTGNIDFNAKGTLKIEGILGGGVYYETSANEARASVIPESELVVADAWEETPDFGFFKVTWTVTAAGETQTVEAMYFLIPPAVIIITIILLTIIIVWIIIMVRKRKEHRARFAV